VCDLETSKKRRLKGELGCCLKEEEEEISAFLRSVVAALALVGFQGKSVVISLSTFREQAVQI